MECSLVQLRKKVSGLRSVEMAAEVVEPEGLSDLAINLCKRHSRAWPSNIDAWANMEFW